LYRISDTRWRRRAVTTQSRLPAHRNPLVIAIEGLCFAGKTTLAHALGVAADTVVIGEYADLAPLPPFPPRHLSDVAAALDHFLCVEHQRALAARAAEAPVVLLDRSPLTLIAHEHGMSALGLPCDPVRAAEIYSSAAETGLILTPDAYLYLAVPDDVTAARQELRGPVAAHLMNRQVRAEIDRACRIWLATLPQERYLELDGTVSPPVLAAMTRRWLSDLTSGLPLPSWRAAAPEPGLSSRSRT
jgi:thymidylate kinase